MNTRTKLTYRTMLVVCLAILGVGCAAEGGESSRDGVQGGGAGPSAEVTLEVDGQQTLVRPAQLSPEEVADELADATQAADWFPSTQKGPHDIVRCNELLWAIQSLYSGLYASTEIGYGGSDYAMLRARANSVGPWELYELCYDQYNRVYLRSLASGRWVSNELLYTGDRYRMLRANATSTFVREAFRLNSLGGWDFTIESLENNLLAAAEYGWQDYRNGMLRARTPKNAVGPWERFRFVAYRR